VEYIRPYRMGQKNNPNNAEAICEVISRLRTRCVPVKSEARQAVLTIGRHAVEAKRMHTTVLQVKVKPNSRASMLEEVGDGTWLAKLKSPPVDGKANEELLALIARRFQCRKSAVSIKSGASGRMKLVRIESA
jgi:uncharacterized protein